jgi:hypothetical protein
VTTSAAFLELRLWNYLFTCFCVCVWMSSQNTEVNFFICLVQVLMMSSVWTQNVQFLSLTEGLSNWMTEKVWGLAGIYSGQLDSNILW